MEDLRHVTSQLIEIRDLRTGVSSLSGQDIGKNWSSRSGLYILQHWDSYHDDEYPLIHLLQTSSYYKLSDLEEAILRIIQANSR